MTEQTSSSSNPELSLKNCRLVPSRKYSCCPLLKAALKSVVFYSEEWLWLKRTREVLVRYQDDAGQGPLKNGWVKEKAHQLDIELAEEPICCLCKHACVSWSMGPENTGSLPSFLADWNANVWLVASASRWRFRGALGVERAGRGAKAQDGQRLLSPAAGKQRDCGADQGQPPALPYQPVRFCGHRQGDGEDAVREDESSKTRPAGVCTRTTPVGDYVLDQ